MHHLGPCSEAKVPRRSTERNGPCFPGRAEGLRPSSPRNCTGPAKRNRSTGALWQPTSSRSAFHPWVIVGSRPVAGLKPECSNQRMTEQAHDKLGRSSLHYAAAIGATGSVAMLIGASADVSLADKAGWTPLHFAAQEGDGATIKLLIDAGADVDPRDQHGNTPLSNAVFNYRGDSSAIDVLRSAGADENATNNHGVSPRSLAHSIANYDVARLFP